MEVVPLFPGSLDQSERPFHSAEGNFHEVKSSAHSGLKLSRGSIKSGFFVRRMRNLS